MVVGRSTERAFRDRVPGALMGAVAVFAVLVAARLAVLEAAELSVFDRWVRAFSAKARADAAPVVLLSLSEPDFERHGYPIADALLASCLDTLASLGASAVGVDLYRPTPSSYGKNDEKSDAQSDLSGWAALAGAVARHPQIVWTELLPARDVAGISAPAFAGAAQVGFNNMLVDPGRIVRRGYLYAWDADGTAHVSLALRLASLHLAARGIAVGSDPADPDRVRIGATSLVPLAEDYGAYAALDAGGYQIPLDFARSVAGFEDLTLDEVLSGRLDAARIQDRVVVVGTDAPSVKDDFNTPVSASQIVKGHRLHAQLTDQLIRAGLSGDAPRRSWPEHAEVALSLGFGALAIAASLGIGALGVVVPVLVLVALIPFALAGMLFGAGVWVPSVTPALAAVAGGGLAFAVRARSEARAQRQLASLFRRFSSSKVADELWRERHAIMEGGRPRPRRVTLTALLSDLVGFTTAAEKLDPEGLLAWIDAYMDAMTRVIESHGGHVDDYVGDGIKANFGVPIPSETPEAIAHDARQAVACALAMGRALEQCNRGWAAQGLPLARQRIGLFTGPAVVGAIGSDERMKYTSVGDTINTAARLEGFADPAAPDGGEGLQRILIGESTRRLLGDAFVLEDLGVHALKGKSEPIQLYRVLGERDGRRREDES